MDNRRFDALVRDTVIAPRRRVIGGLLALALGGFASANDLAATEAACKGNSCHGKKRPCQHKKHCLCFKRIQGGSFCGNVKAGICTDCASDADCPAGAACIEGSGRCCRQQTATACVAPCGGTLPVATSPGTRGLRLRS